MSIQKTTFHPHDVRVTAALTIRTRGAHDYHKLERAIETAVLFALDAITAVDARVQMTEPGQPSVDRMGIEHITIELPASRHE